MANLLWEQILSPNSPLQPGHPASLWECFMANWAAPCFLSSGSFCSLGQPFGTCSWTHCAEALSLSAFPATYALFFYIQESSACSPYALTLFAKLLESLFTFIVARGLLRTARDTCSFPGSPRVEYICGPQQVPTRMGSTRRNKWLDSLQSF